MLPSKIQAHISPHPIRNFSVIRSGLFGYPSAIFWLSIRDFSVIHSGLEMLKFNISSPIFSFFSLRQRAVFQVPNTYQSSPKAQSKPYQSLRQWALIGSRSKFYKGQILAKQGDSLVDCQIKLLIISKIQMLNKNVKKNRILTFRKGHSVGFRSRIIDWGQKKTAPKWRGLFSGSNRISRL